MPETSIRASRLSSSVAPCVTRTSYQPESECAAFDTVSTRVRAPLTRPPSASTTPLRRHSKPSESTGRFVATERRITAPSVTVESCGPSWSSGSATIENVRM